MLIREMTVAECVRMLGESTLGRLACAEEGQPYVVPVYLAPYDDFLYGFSSLGKKIELMRVNPLVCVEFDDIKSGTEWTTLLVFGSYEELPDIPELEPARLRAHDLLRKRAMWWEPAFVAVEGSTHPKTFAPVFYRICIDRITGHCASPESSGVTSLPEAKRGFLKSILRRVWPSTAAMNKCRDA